MSRANVFFGTKQIYQRSIGSHRAEITLLVVVGVAILTLSLLAAYAGLNSREGIRLDGAFFLFVIGVLAALTAIVRGIGRLIIIDRISKQRHYLNDLDLDSPGRRISCLGLSVIREETKEGARSRQAPDGNFRVRLFEQEDDWWIGDASSTTYNDKGATTERCYTIFEAKLRQIVPHLVFDSRKAKGRQFRSIYLKSERLQAVFGAEFERLFVSHSPEHHDIETLSFITPEVVEAMIDLPDCDLELIDNSLLAYAPFLPAKKVDDFRCRWLNLHRKLNDNLRHYQLPDQDIKPFGRRLLKDHRNPILFGLLLLALGQRPPLRRSGTARPTSVENQPGFGAITWGAYMRVNTR